MTGNDVRVCFASNMNCQHCHFCQALSSCIMVVSMEKGRGKGERKNAGAQALIYHVKTGFAWKQPKQMIFLLRREKTGCTLRVSEDAVSSRSLFVVISL